MANVATLSAEIWDAFSKGRQTCALCSLWLDEEASLTEKIRRAGDSTERVLAASGFCNRHTQGIHQATSTQDGDDARGCLTCARVVLKKFEENMVPLLSSVKGARGTRGEPLAVAISQLEETISGDAMCPVCVELLESDNARIASLLQMLESKDFAEVYSKSRAMCMPHFVSAMQLVPASTQKSLEGVWSLLMRTELSSLEWVDHLLNERMKKYSWDFRNESMSSEEANAQEIAMFAISGVEGLYCRPRKTSLRPAR